MFRLLCVSAGAALVLGYARHLSRVHPELREGVWRRHYVKNLPTVWKLSRPGWLVDHPLQRTSSGSTTGVEVSDRTIAGVRVRMYHSTTTPNPPIALLWIHGGGLVGGTPDADDKVCAYMARTLNAVVYNPDYTLASIAPYPAALDDCERVLAEIFSSASPHTKVIVAGQSAGGGLAASLVHKTVDSGRGRIAFQLLFEPMLDNTTTFSPGRGVLCWGWLTNMLGWRAYLRDTHAAPEPARYAVAARRHDLRGLPPTFIAVGELDLFYDEDLTYASRLRAAGVPTTFYPMKGTYHGTLIRCLHTNVMQQMWDQALGALRRAI